MEIGSAIAIIRKSKKIKQKDLAAKCGISVNALCQIENNNSFPQPQNLRSIAGALGVSVGLILFNCIDDEHIPKNKVSTLNILKTAIADLLYK
jgi:transcriptional regulator with XRE-family HTH domain